MALEFKLLSELFNISLLHCFSSLYESFSSHPLTLLKQRRILAVDDWANIGPPRIASIQQVRLRIEILKSPLRPFSVSEIGIEESK